MMRTGGTKAFILLAMSSACSMYAVDAGLLEKPKLTRAEKGRLLDKDLQAHIQQLSAADSQRLVQSEADPSAKALVAWLRAEGEGNETPERVWHYGHLFNCAKKLDPMQAQMIFDRVTGFYPLDYVEISLFETMTKAGWKIERVEFDTFTAQFLVHKKQQASP